MEQFKELPFTIENAEKYPDARLLTDYTDAIFDEWEISTSKRFLIYKSFEDYEVEQIDKHTKGYILRIPVQLRKVPLKFTLTGHCSDLQNFGYFINIDEQGNTVGEPFKDTAQ